MEKLRRGLAALLTLLPFAVGAQEASQAEQSMVRGVIDCITEGLPADWIRLHVVVKLEKPGAKTGDVLYLVTREGDEEKLEPYTPCDPKKPALAIVELRERLPRERRGWIEARLTVLSTGQFQLKYDFPDSAPRPPADNPPEKKPAAKGPAKK